MNQTSRRSGELTSSLNKFREQQTNGKQAEPRAAHPFHPCVSMSSLALLAAQMQKWSLTALPAACLPLEWGTVYVLSISWGFVTQPFTAHSSVASLGVQQVRLLKPGSPLDLAWKI
jgi:hypothetical protein